MMSDLVKILLNIDKSKSLEINTKSINRGLSKICIFCQLSMHYISLLNSDFIACSIKMHLSPYFVLCSLA